MHLTELNEDEQRILVALVKQVVHADDALTAPERATLTELAGVLGPEVWNARVRSAAERFTSREALAAALPVVRPEARELIIDWLDRFASADGVDTSEDAILDWVAAQWGIEAPSAFFEEDDTGAVLLDE